MIRISIQELSDLAASHRLTDVLLPIDLGSDDGLDVWNAIEELGVALCFEEHCIVIQQPEGTFDIDFYRTSLSQWSKQLSDAYPDLTISLLRVFKLCCFPLDLDCVPPQVLSIETYSESGCHEVHGVLFKVSTGFQFGINSMWSNGLRLILDGHQNFYIDSSHAWGGLVMKEYSCASSDAGEPPNDRNQKGK